MYTKHEIKSEKGIKSNFETGKKTDSKQEIDHTIDIFPDEDAIPDGPEISLTDDTISSLSHDNNRHISIKQIIFEEELKKEDDKNKKNKPENTSDKNTETENKSVLNPDIEKITEVDPEEKILREIKEKKLRDSSRNRNQMFL